MELVIQWLKFSWVVVNISRKLILWNTFLAVIPLLLSVWLFRWSKNVLRFRRWTRSPLWWLGFAIFILFLPNAPYILTDIIHYIDLIQERPPDSIIIFTLTPQFFLYLLAGWQCYVISLMNLGYYLDTKQRNNWIIPAELLLHLLSAIGIYLGRFLRWNSWNLITHPTDIGNSLVATLSHKRPLVAIAITFVILWGLYWPVKQLNLGLVLRFQQLRKLKA